MNRNNWIDRRRQLPVAMDADPNGYVFAWHQYQGVMLVHWSRFERNSFHLYWMNPLEDGMTWISTKERLPSATDSDCTGCIAVMNSGGQMSVTGWHQVQKDANWAYWKPLPPPPIFLTDLRKAQ